MYETIKQLKTENKELRQMKDFESKFSEWFNIVSGRDPQYQQDVEWEWEIEINKFLKNPNKCLSEEKWSEKKHQEYEEKELEQTIMGRRNYEQ